MNKIELLEASAEAQLNEMDELGRNYGVSRGALFVYGENLGLDFFRISEWAEDCANDFIGEFNDPTELACYFIDELGAFDVDSMGEFRHYFDYEKYGRDLLLDGVWEIDGLYFFNR